MRIEIHHIPTQGTILQHSMGAEQLSALKELIDKGECSFSTPIDLSLTVAQEKDFFKVDGRFTANLRMACSRCLTRFDLPVSKGFKLNYSRKILDDIHDPDAEGVELTAQQVGIIYFEGDEIDFSDAIQEQVILAIPYRPLCREACKGLCHQCGADLNQAPCQCPKQEVESPFAVLKNLKVKD